MSRDDLEQEQGGPELVRDERGLALMGAGMELRVDFAEMLPRVRQDRLGHELLVRAARVKGVEHPVAWDATAGLGEDSFLLAAVGFKVELYERDARVAALLHDGLERAAAEPELADIVCRMHLHEGDSIAALEQLSSEAEPRASDADSPVQDAEVIPARPDVIYLDPMFPARSKSAAVKKKAQLMQMLEEPCTDEEACALVRAALAARPRKVVVKRPLKGPYLAGIKPAYSVEGRAVRFDVLVV